MNEQIYLSTNIFINKKLSDILEFCSANGFKNIELSYCEGYNAKSLDLLKGYYKKLHKKFLLHNYFPPPENPFVINIASNNLKILKLSRQHCKKAIEISAEFKARFYSVHSGACYHPRPEDLNKGQVEYNVFDKKEALEILFESLGELSNYARRHDMILAIENHVLTEFYFKENKNDMLLGVTAEELIDIIKAVNSGNLAVLVDVGHLKVSAKTMGFSPEVFINKLSSHIMGVHLSDNDGCLDTHSRIDNNSWFWQVLKEFINREVFWILEAKNCELGQIKEQISLLNSFLNSNH